MRQKACPFDICRFLIKHLNKAGADDFTFLFWIAHPIQSLQKHLSSICMNKRDIIMTAKQLYDLFSLALAQQAMINKHTSEPLTNRFMQ